MLGAYEQQLTIHVNRMYNLQANLHPRPEEVDVFLAMDEHGAGVRGRSGNRPLAWTSTKVPPLHASADPGETF